MGDFQPNPKAIYWTDVETSGLDPNEHRILEICVWRAPFDKPTSADEIFNRTFRFTDWSDVDPYVIDMHHKSGLMIDCIRSQHTVEEATKDLVDLLLKKFKDDWMVRDHEPDGPLRMATKSNEMPVLGGSSVDFDRGFLRRDMPDLAALFSHRVYDISSLKLLCRSIGMPPQPKRDAHRSRADIVESLQHTRECFKWLQVNCTEKLLDHHGCLPL